jgi:hypothetical protein
VIAVSSKTLGRNNDAISDSLKTCYRLLCMLSHRHTCCKVAATIRDSPSDLPCFPDNQINILRTGILIPQLEQGINSWKAPRDLLVVSQYQKSMKLTGDGCLARVRCR